VSTRFPVGGPREPVYAFLREHGFTMSNRSDKEWHRLDGMKVHIYGAGSKARVVDHSGALLADDELEVAMRATRP